MAIKESFIRDGKKVKVIIEKEVKAYASGAHLILPKKYAGKMARVMIEIPLSKNTIF